MSARFPGRDFQKIIMTITSGQQDALQAVATTTSIMSIAGSATIIAILLRRKRQSGMARLETVDSLVLVMSILDIAASVNFGLGELPNVAGGSKGGFCQLQAFLIQTFSLSTVFWNSCMAHNLYCWVVQKKDLPSLGDNLKWYLTFSLGVPLAFAIGLIAGDTLGFATLWCWIEGDTNVLRFVCFYLFVVLAWVFNLFVFIRVSYVIRHRIKKSRNSATRSVWSDQTMVVPRLPASPFIYVFTICFIASHCIASHHILLHVMSPNPPRTNTSATFAARLILPRALFVGR